MKVLTILNFCLLLVFSGYSQTEFELKPSKGALVSSYIYKDGSFDIFCGDMVYPYDEEGNSSDAPYEFRDDVMARYAQNQSKILIDKVNDIRYAFEPETSTGYTDLDYNEGVIMVDKLGKKNQQRVIVKFEDILGVKSNEYIRRDLIFSYFAENGNPIFVRIRLGMSTKDPAYTKGAKLDKKKYNLFVEKIELNIEDNTTTVTSHLINKAPVLPGKSIISMNFIGDMKGKLFVALSYLERSRDSLGKVDVWSISEGSSEEKLEYTYSYASENKYYNSRMRSNGDSNTSGLFFYHAYGIIIPELKNKLVPAGSGNHMARYTILKISPSLEFTVSNLEIPPSVARIESSPPPLEVFNSSSSTRFLCRGSHGELLVMTDRDDDTITFNLIQLPGYTFENYDFLFDEKSESLADLAQKPLFDANSVCKLCGAAYSHIAFRVDENNIARLVYCNYLREPVCGNNCKIEYMKVLVGSEEIK